MRSALSALLSAAIAAHAALATPVRARSAYSVKEKHSLCPTFPSSVMRVEQHGGDHTLSGEAGAEVAQKILRELGF